MLQKNIFGIIKDNNINVKNEKMKSFDLYLISKKYLYYKYSKFEYSFSLICSNNLIYNEKCRLVARFKDYLVLDDLTEFFHRFYFKQELNNRLNRIFDFYESYCKIFPNYMIIPENKFLYRNIRKKQKMIDAFNEIQKEEEENRKHLKTNNENKEAFFNDKIKESIEKYNQSISNILNYTIISKIDNNLNNEIDDDKIIISISLNRYKDVKLNEYNNKKNNKQNNLNYNNDNTIFNIINQLENNNNNKLEKKSETVKKEKNYINITNKNLKNSNINAHNKKKNNDNINVKIIDDCSGKKKVREKMKNKNNISHKQSGSLPVSSNLFKIIHNNINNIIINDENNSHINKEMVININNNYFQLKEPNKKNEEIKKLKNKNNEKKLKSNSKESNIKIGEKKIFTVYNTLNSSQNKIKPLIKHVLSPTKNENNKQYLYKNNNKFYLNSSKNTNKKRIYRNDFIKSNISKTNSKLTKCKTLDNDSNIFKANNLFGNKLKITKNQNLKDKLKIKSVNETTDKTKMSVNRKIVINYLKNSERKKIYKRPFNTIESISIKNFSNNKNNEIHYIMEKNKTLSLLNNPITFKINRNTMHKAKTNSMQINNKNYLYSSINFTKGKKLTTQLDSDKKNNEKIEKKIIYIKTQYNSDIEFVINKKNNEKSSKNNLKKEKKIINQENKYIFKNKNSTEIKDKYHKYLKEKMITHNSYDTQNKLNLFKRYRTLNGDNFIFTNNINKLNIIKKQNETPSIKKYILSPNEKIKGIINNYIRTPIQYKYTIINKGSKLKTLFIKDNKLKLLRKKIIE